jgi:tRNA(Ile)-lysidine synthase
MSEIVEAIKNYCTCNDLLHPEDRVLLAVSGGPDSVALFHIMRSMLPTFHLHIEVAHLEHGLRGEDSKQDQRFVQKLCKRHGIHFHTRNIDVFHTREKAESVEEAARRVRLEYLYGLLRQFGFDSIATGHTRDDNVETVIFRLISGTGPAGFSGIQPRCGRIIHPLLGCTKNELKKYLASHNHAFRIDHTNYNISYRRNKIRREVIPRLNEINSRSSDHVLNLARIIHEEDQHMNTEAVRIFESLKKKNEGLVAGYTGRGSETERIYIDAKEYTRLSDAMKRRIILLAFDTLCRDDSSLKKPYISFVVLESLVKQPLQKNKILYHNELFRIRKEYENVVFEKKVVCAFNKGYLYKVNNFESSIDIEEIGKEIRFELKRSVSSFEKNKLYFDFDKLVLPIHIRNRVQGDRIALPNVGVKKLKALFIDDKVPFEMRYQVPIIISDEEIAGVFCSLYGKLNRVSVNHRVSEQTEKILVCELAEPDHRS